MRGLSGMALNIHTPVSEHKNSMLKCSHGSKEATVQFCTIRREKLVPSKGTAGQYAVLSRPGVGFILSQSCWN